MRLWLVRHAAPVIPPGVCYGRSDVPADPAATAQAAGRLHQALPDAVVWRVSPLARTRALGDALRAWRAADPPPAVDERLVEFDFGAWELLPWDRVPRDELDAWAADFADYRPGGGDSVRDLLGRVRQALQTIQRRTSGADEVWVTHAGVIRAVQYLMLPGQPTVPKDAQQWPVSAPAYGEWLCLDGVERLGID